MAVRRAGLAGNGTAAGIAPGLMTVAALGYSAKFLFYFKFDVPVLGCVPLD